MRTYTCGSAAAVLPSPFSLAYEAWSRHPCRTDVGRDIPHPLPFEKMLRVYSTCSSLLFLKISGTRERHGKGRRSPQSLSFQAAGSLPPIKTGKRDRCSFSDGRSTEISLLNASFSKTKKKKKKTRLHLHQPAPGWRWVGIPLPPWSRYVFREYLASINRRGLREREGSNETGAGEGEQAGCADDRGRAI